MNFRSAQNGKTVVTISQEDWTAIGKMSGWIRMAEGNNELVPEPLPELPIDDKKIPPGKQPDFKVSIPGATDNNDDDEQEEGHYGIDLSKDHNNVPEFNFGPTGNKILISVWKGEVNSPRVVFRTDIPNERFDEFYKELYRLLTHSVAFNSPRYCKMETAGVAPQDIAARLIKASEAMDDTIIVATGVYASPEMYELFKQNAETLQPVLEQKRLWILVSS